MAKNSIITNKKSTTGIRTNYKLRRRAYVTPKSHKGWLKHRFSVFRNKIEFNRINSATKFRSVKMSSGRVVEQSISYEIKKKYGRKVFPST